MTIMQPGDKLPSGPMPCDWLHTENTDRVAGTTSSHYVRRVSVIVPTRDRPELLDEALASIRALEARDLELEVIVSDNSVAGSAQQVARQHGARYVKATVPGPAAARNAGVEIATGQYLAFLDDDDLWLDTHLRAHLERLEADPTLDGVIGQYCPIDASGRSGAPYPSPAFMQDDVLQGVLATPPHIGAVVVRASAWTQVGPFDQALLAAEEWDWCLRLALRCRVVFLAQPCMIFRARVPSVEEDHISDRYQRHTRHVFWRNIRRAGFGRLPTWFVIRAWLKRDGYYAARFLVSAELHVERGNHGAAWRAFVLAARSSPLHVAAWLARSAPARRAFRRSFRHSEKIVGLRARLDSEL